MVGIIHRTPSSPALDCAMSETIKTSVLDSTLVIAVVAACILTQSRILDTTAASGLCHLLGVDTTLVLEKTITAQALNSALSLTCACIAFVCARQLKGLARAVVMVQLLALTVLLALPIYKIVLSTLEPFTYLSFGLLGLSFGLASARLREVNERSRTQQVEALLRNRELLETRLQLIKQDEIERKMLAADLHDQVLNDLKLMLQMLVKQKDILSDSFLTSATARIELAMENIRQVMESLCPSDLEHIGLIAALEECLKDRAEKADFLPQFRCEIAESDIQALSKIEKALLYRLVQESITNICKHANATRVRLTVIMQNKELWIRVVDDGIGLQKNGSDKSRGLQYMRLRAEIVGARINWAQGNNERGTAVDIRKNLVI